MAKKFKFKPRSHIYGEMCICQHYKYRHATYFDYHTEEIDLLKCDFCDCLEFELDDS